VQAFARLYEILENTTSTNAKVAAMVGYFRKTPPEDAAWAVYFLAGRRPKRLIGGSRLRAWLGESLELPDWLVEECYAHVGDLAECIALLVDSPDADADDIPLHRWLEDRILPLAGQPETAQREAVTGWWRALERRQCFLLNKLLTGGLRVGVSRILVVRALAEFTGLERSVLTHRLTGDWQPTAAFFEGLKAPPGGPVDRSRPYPFFLASPLEKPPETLGDTGDWLAEWKWDGIRAQLLCRGGEHYLWSRGEELVSERFPEIIDAARSLPEGLVLDGEILAWRDGVRPFAELQQRLNRKRLGQALLARIPVVLLAYDLLEVDGEDRRDRPLRERRARLGEVLANAPAPLRLSPAVPATDWADLARRREESRARAVEGLMLKRLDSVYESGRRRGHWWKWKVDPYTVDAVMIYAQSGHGRRASLFTDYTFAVWDGDRLVPLARAYSGLTDAEIDRLDRWIRRHTLERFGPVRSVEPVQVFELAFEGINASNRHKSGVALRFPRIHRWREDKPAAEADTLATVQALLRESLPNER